jgi:hypothetical protein
LSDSVDLVVEGLAIGVVATRYGRRALRVPFDVYAAALETVLAAQRNLNATVSHGSLNDLLSALGEELARLANRAAVFAGIASPAEVAVVGRRLERIEKRLTALEQSRARPRIADPLAETPTRVSYAPAEQPMPAEGIAAGASGLPTPGARDGAAGRSATMVIGSVPEVDRFEVAPERASSLSSEPDAWSAYLSRGGTVPEDRVTGRAGAAAMRSRRDED